MTHIDLTQDRTQGEGPRNGSGFSRLVIALGTTFNLRSILARPEPVSFISIYLLIDRTTGRQAAVRDRRSKPQEAGDVPRMYPPGDANASPPSILDRIGVC